MSATTSGSTALDLDVLETDHTPTFVVKIGSGVIDFEILYSNEAFRTGGFREIIQKANRATLLFRSWTQAVGDFDASHELGNVIWTAQIAGKYGTWKIVKASEYVSEEQRINDERKNLEARVSARSRHSNHIDRREKFMKELGVESLPSVQIPKTNLTAAGLESMQTMMEMSDVGVFQYSPQGTLIHGNDAWYKLSSHPRELSAHNSFSFMDLVYPDDQAIVMSAWNTLLQGKPVTFEMRWKARPESDDVAQWVLSSCLPVYEDGRLVSITGNTIDINAQKKSQEAAVAKLEALESARKSENKFTRFAQLSPIAIYIYSPEGMQYVNDQFFELTGQERMEFEKLDWRKIVAEEDIAMTEAAWATVLQGAKTELQFRLKKTWVNQEDIRSNIWVQGTSYPEIEKDGSVISVMGTLFDISQFKWAESVQRRMIEEALEAKRQQENFIDMTSHELRNPLSAVVQCADSVIATLNQLCLNPPGTIGMPNEHFNEELLSSIDALQTIVSCSLHQKRVIDDVLTLSKLDSNLILITPIQVQPDKVVSEALKMFDVECSQMQITLDFHEDDTLKGLEWVMLDPSRLLQILINLLTNAIKFTKDRPLRKVIVTLGGSLTRLPAVWQGIRFTNCESSSDIPDRPDYGNGKKAFIWLTVEDTGCGMAVDEQKKLFSRFSQATPRTHIRYGGSGLGLFISKSLASLQGGSVGVKSTADVGSTFAFFVSTRIAPAPINADVSRAMRPYVHRTISMEDAMRKARLHILMVEDNVVNQRVLSKQLQKLGCLVYVVNNGLEALEWLKGSIYWRGEPKDDNGADIADIQKPTKLDIILMDIEMPVMDGLTCARCIREYEEEGLLAPPVPTAHSISSSSISPIATFPIRATSEKQPRNHEPSRKLPILAVSANARSEQVEQAKSAGMDDAISKPFRIPDLWPKMEALVSRCQWVRDVECNHNEHART